VGHADDEKKKGQRRFEGLEVCGFRRLYDVNIALRPLMVLIGTNGSGKTSFLDAWSLLAASANKELARTLSRLGGTMV